MKQLQALYQQYITAAEERMMELEIVVEEAERHSEQEDSSDRPEAPFVSHTLPVTAGVRVLGGGPDDAVIIPSTTELMDYVYSSQNNHNNNNEQDGDKDMNEDGDESGSDSKDDLAARPLDPSATFSQIVALQKECLQKADEKVAIAEQAYAIVDSTVQRLDHDLRSMEQFLLQVRPQSPCCRVFVVAPCSLLSSLSQSFFSLPGTSPIQGPVLVLLQRCHSWPTLWANPTIW